MDDDRGDRALRESWARMVKAALRMCVVIHGDDAAAVGAMLEALRETAPEHWPMLAESFEAQWAQHGRKSGEGQVALNLREKSTAQDAHGATKIPAPMETQRPLASALTGR
ncbi:MAG: hypothetical protein ACKN9W_04390 [Methylococcus sp.]